jgi:hypothetical protein
VENIDVHGRTQDGLRVQVEGIKVIFSRSQKRSGSDAADSYPFDPKALREIVYFPRQPWTRHDRQIQRKFIDLSPNTH